MSIEEVKSEDEVVFFISEFECRVIGNRLHKIADRYERIHSNLDVPPRFEQDYRHWSSRFLEKCSTRAKNDEEYYEQGQKRHTDSNYNVKITLTGYECWSLGNRLFEIGQWFSEKGHDGVGKECKWIGRRFHAEKKQQTDED